jgi:hypothetical protein
MLTWAAARLRNDSWNEGYAALVQLYGHSLHRPGWRAGSAVAASQRGLGWTLSADASTRSPKDAPLDSQSVVLEEGAAILRGTSQQTAAREFLAFLEAQPKLDGGPPSPLLDPRASDLLAVLLGATLVDAQDELVAAWKAVDRTVPRPAQAESWLTEPPPWPPASVAKLLARGGDRELGMVQDLASQIAADPAQRFWLGQSWLRPGRRVNGALLTELASAEEGRLVAEPRFRTWLRGEWTAWARQRYRRVARLVLAPSPGLTIAPAQAGNAVAGTIAGAPNISSTASSPREPAAP